MSSRRLLLTTAVRVKMVLTLVIGFALCLCFTHGEEMFLKPGADEHLWPATKTTPVISRWELTSEPGSKIIAGCVMMKTTCSEHTLSIFDGVQTTKHCGPEETYVLKSSDSSKMTVTIETSGLKHGSYCKVSASKPFLNDVFKKRDSSEDGQQEGSRKTSCKCGWTNKKANRIVGGSETASHEYPWAVLLGLARNNQYYCGGSIITKRHVLTAAHCTYPFKRLKLAIYAGLHDSDTPNKPATYQKIAVKTTLDHPDYNERSNIGDISVILLADDIKFSSEVGPVCLPNVQNDILGHYIKVMGWGHIKTKGPASPVLRKVDIKVIDLDICRSVYSSINTKKPTQVCTWAPNRDSCQGDSGGPLVWLDSTSNRLTQVAVVSFGRDCASTDPAVNTDVWAYMDWIRKVIKESSSESICV